MVVQFSRASAFEAREPHDADAAARVKALLQSTGTSVAGALRELAGASAEYEALAANIGPVGSAHCRWLRSEQTECPGTIAAGKAMLAWERLLKDKPNAAACAESEPHDADAAARVTALLQSTGTSVAGALHELAGAVSSWMRVGAWMRGCVGACGCVDAWMRVA